MSEQTHISANIPASPACGQWETLLPEAMDGQLEGELRAEDRAFFSAHLATCPYCTELYEEAKRGREWLDFLSTEPELPAGLLDKILAQTGPGIEPHHATGFGILGPPLQPALAGGLAYPQPWQKPGLMGFIRRFAEPRLMMTAAMAFFSILLTLNLTGVRLKDMKLSTLRPQSVRSYMQRQIAVASTPIIRYYDHLRLVYEVQQRMRELRRNAESEKQDQSPNGESQHQPGHKDGGSRLGNSPDPSLAPPQQSARPVFYDDDFQETSLHLHGSPAHSGGSARNQTREDGERSNEWIA